MKALNPDLESSTCTVALSSPPTFRSVMIFTFPGPSVAVPVNWNSKFDGDAVRSTDTGPTDSGPTVIFDIVAEKWMLGGLRPIVAVRATVTWNSVAEKARLIPAVKCVDPIVAPVGET